MITNLINTIIPTLHLDIDHHHDGGFWEEFLAVTLDPAHILAELVFTIIFDGVFIALLYNVVFKKLILPKIKRDMHTTYDEEHNITHDEDK